MHTYALDNECRLEQQHAIKQAAAHWDPEHRMRPRVSVFASLQEAMDYLAYISYRLYTTINDQLEATEDQWAITVAKVRRERQLPLLCQATFGLADMTERYRLCDYQTATERLERIGQAYSHDLSEIENGRVAKFLARILTGDDPTPDAAWDYLSDCHVYNRIILCAPISRTYEGTPQMHSVNHHFYGLTQNLRIVGTQRPTASDGRPPMPYHVLRCKSHTGLTSHDMDLAEAMLMCARDTAVEICSEYYDNSKVPLPRKFKKRGLVPCVLGTRLSDKFPGERVHEYL